MSDGTKISWSDATWNPITGCSKTSEGCLNCYIDRTPPFRMAHRKFDGPGIGATTGVQLHSERLGIPMKWRKPRMIFVCSLADLFQDEVPDRFIADVFAVISIATHHIFQVLTKRHARMRSLLNSPRFWVLVDGARKARGFEPLPGDGPHALPNAWIGVSTENQKWADIRIPALLQTPAAVRWISAEPMVGPIDLHAKDSRTFGPQWLPPVAHGVNTADRRAGDGSSIGDLYKAMYGPNLDWVVCGGESGPNARPMHPNWARSLRDQCVAAGVVYHFKQWGEWSPLRPLGGAQAGRFAYVGPNGERFDERNPPDMDPSWGSIYRVGKKSAGRLLDGRTWDDFPRTLVGGAA